MLPGLLVANGQAQQAGLVSPEELPLLARAIGHLRRWATPLPLPRRLHGGQDRVRNGEAGT